MVLMPLEYHQSHGTGVDLYGDSFCQSLRDYKFGFYSTNYSRAIDQTVTKRIHICLWSSGNENGSTIGASYPTYNPFVVYKRSYITNSTLSHNSDGLPMARSDTPHA
jgi:hypothetical protein